MPRKGCFKHADLASVLSEMRKEGDCLVWPKCRDRDGYGSITYQCRAAKTHRLVWELANGPIPKGLFVLHSCDNPPCCNLQHLRLGTIQDNNNDRTTRGRTAKGDRSGARLHPERFTGRVGTDNPSAKIDVPIVRAIRASTKSYQKTADAFGVSKSLVAQICRKEAWRHVE